MLPFGQEQDPREQQRDEIENVFGQLGVPGYEGTQFGAQSLKPKTEINFGPGQRASVQQDLEHGGGMLRQMQYGLASPLDRWTADKPKPTDTRERIGHLMGSFASWGALSVGAMAVIGSGLGALGVAGLGAKAAVSGSATWGAKAASLGISSSIVGGFQRWTQGEDDPMAIARASAISGAIGAAIPYAGHKWRTSPVVDRGLNKMRDTANRAMGRFGNQMAEIDIPFEDAMARLKRSVPEMRKSLSIDVEKRMLKYGLLPESGRMARPAFKIIPQKDAMRTAHNIAREGAEGTYQERLSTALRQVHQGDVPLNKIPTESRLDVFIDMWKQSPDDTRMLEAFRPIFKNAKQVMDVERQMAMNRSGQIVSEQIRNGTPMGLSMHNLENYGYQNPSTMQNIKGKLGAVRVRLGETDLGPEDIDISKFDPVGQRLKQIITRKGAKPGETPLRYTLDKLEERINFNVRQMDTVLNKAGTHHPGFLQGGQRRLYDDAAEEMARAFSVRDQLTGQVSYGLRLADKGMVKSEAMINFEKALRAQREELMEPIYGRSEFKRQFLREHGVNTEHELSQSAQQKLKQMLSDMQIPDEIIGYQLSPLSVTPDDAHEVFRQAHRYPDIFTGDNTLSETVMRETNVFTRLLFAPLRKAAGEKIAREFRVNKDAVDTIRRTYMSEADKILKPFMTRKKGAKLARERISRYMEASTPDQMPAGLTASERKAGDLLADLYERAGKDLGINAEHFRKNYVPLMRQVAKTGDDRLMAKLPSEMEWFAQFERGPGGNDVLREWDAYKLFHRYIKGGTANKYYKPLFESTDDYFLNLAREGGAKISPEYKGAEGLKNAMNEGLIPGKLVGHIKATHGVELGMLGRPDGLEQYVDSTITGLLKTFKTQMQKQGISETAEIMPGVRYTQAIANYLAQIQHMGALGFNPFSAIRNLTQQILPMAQLDPNPIVGMQYWMKAKAAMRTPEGRAINKVFNHVLTGRQAEQAMNQQYLALNKAAGGDQFPLPGDMRGFWEKFSDWGMKMFKAADRNNVETSYMMRFLKSMDEGVPLARAADDAYGFAMSTQFMYGIDSPKIVRHPIGRALAPFLSWPMHWASNLGDAWGSNKVGMVSSLAGMAVGSELLSATGLNFRNIHPIEVGKNHLAVQMIHQQSIDSMTTRMGGAAAGLVSATMANDPEASRRAWDNFHRSVKGMIPGAQLSRINTVIKAARDDWTIRDRQGRVQQHMKTAGDPLYENIGIPTEAVIRLIGSHTSDSDRWQAISGTIQPTESSYRHQRRQAIEAYLEGNMTEFKKAQIVLMERYGRVVQPHDIQQEMDQRQETAVERRLRTLPENLRERVRDSINPALLNQ